MNIYNKFNLQIVLLLIAILICGCSHEQAEAQTMPSNITSTQSIVVESTDKPFYSNKKTSETTVVFAVIGDYGSGDRAAQDVAKLVKGWQPEFIITAGDNNYPDGSMGTIDANIGQFYHEYIYSYAGEFGEGADQNRFFPSLGNHDWMTNDANPYLEYFTLPGNERYYDFTWGTLLHFFALDSDPNEKDGVTWQTVQAAWLEERLAESTATWKIVYMHHPPFSSGLEGSMEWMRWPYKEWEADAVIAGHEHFYERLIKRRLVYFVNGLGGGEIRSFDHPLVGSQVRYNDDYGAMRVEATSKKIMFEFISRDGEVIDSYEIER